MNDMTTSGLDLRVRRIQQDIKAKDLAVCIGKTPQWVSRIEARRVVAPETARVYLDGLATLASIATFQTAAEVA